MPSSAEQLWRKDLSSGPGYAVGEALRRILVHDSKDHSADKRDAWIYGVVVGWNRESLQELAQKFRWSEQDVQRLEQQHRLFQRVTEKKR